METIQKMYLNINFYKKIFNFLSLLKNIENFLCLCPLKIVSSSSLTKKTRNVGVQIKKEVLF